MAGRKVTTSPPPAAVIPPIAPELLRAADGVTPQSIPPVRDKAVFWIKPNTFTTGGKYPAEQLRLGRKVMKAARLSGAHELRVTCEAGKITIEREIS